MISKETKKLILYTTLILLYTHHANASTDCTNNADRQLYTEIGCKPIYSNGGPNNNACPVAYNCEHVFARSSDKCYFNGKVYEPKTRLSVADSASARCLTNCVCDQKTIKNKTVTKFTSTYVQCASSISLLAEPCYYQFNKDSCCEIGKNCPKKNEKVHECVYNNKKYRNGQRFDVGNYVQCVCSPDFNGTVTDKSCKKVGCNYEILYMENILNRNAPVFLEKSDGCPFEWYSVEHDQATAVGPTTTYPGSVLGNKSGDFECKYGDFSFPLGQTLTIGRQSSSSTYETICSCKTPPLVTCDRVLRRKVPKTDQ